MKKILLPFLFLALLQVLHGEEVLTPQHLAKLRHVISAKISPDGSFVAYILNVPRPPVKEKSGPANRELHVVYPDGVSHPFVTGDIRVSAIRWTPDGKRISFLAKRGEDKHKLLYAIPIDGGEAQKILDFKSAISAYTWSPDATRVAFIATDAVPEETEKLKEKGFTQKIYEEDHTPTRVYIADLETDDAEPRALELPGVPSGPLWAPTENLIALALAPTPLIDDHYMSRKVHIVNVDSGEIVARFKNPGKLGKLAWSPDAQHLAFLSGEDTHDPSAGRLMVVPREGGELKELLPGFKGDFSSIVWSDPDTVMYVADEGVWNTLGTIRRDGSKNTVLIEPGKMVGAGLSLASDGSTKALIIESPHHPKEVAILGSDDEVPQRKTTSNPWLADIRLATQEVVTFVARDGLHLHGLLIRPLEEEKGKRYPLILTVHGGPEAHLSNGWLTRYVYPGQIGAAHGFAVFYPNYRGSTGRGVEFSKLGQADYAGKEFDDLVDAADHFIASGLADAKRVGITGGSYGGYASAWGATRLSERFAASVMFVGISDLVSKTGTTDIPREMHLVHARKKLYDNWQWFRERSPIYYAENARTPLLILHGQNDTRVHPSQSMEMYRHIKELGKTPVRLVFYPGEGHGNRKSAARLDYNLRMLRWFDHYLKGPGGSAPPYELDYGVEVNVDAEKATEPETPR